MKQALILLDAGHGGMIYNYQTEGKRSPKPEIGSPLYEGVFNRAIIFELQLELTLRGIPCTVLAPENADIPLRIRVDRANKLHEDYNCFGLSAHVNGFGEGWERTNYWSAFTAPNANESAHYSTYYYDKMREQYPDMQFSGPFQERFQILTATKMPFVLVENFFMTNKDGYSLLTSSKERNKIVNALLGATVCVYDDMTNF